MSESIHSFRTSLKSSSTDERKVPTPPHRHAAPSAPWPWVDIHDSIDAVQLASPLAPIPPLCDHSTCNGCWIKYPQSQFPNWTERQVRKSKISEAILQNDPHMPSTIYQADVNSEGFFSDAGLIEASNVLDTWNHLLTSERPANNRVRALFIDRMSGPVLQMLGTCYNVEPFFFSSSLNWIPSRYQENVRYGEGDHITICLTFLKSVELPNLKKIQISPYAELESVTIAPESTRASPTWNQIIDTQAPLVLDEHHLVLDLLSVHLIRNKDGNTILSYHSNISDATSAKYLHERIRFAGQSVYWQNIFQRSSDPTFVLLLFIWHTIYAWDEALERLYEHMCSLETSVIKESDVELTENLHIIRAHLLHYSSLLDDLRKTVEFVRDASNPVPSPDRQYCEIVMQRECANLLNEVERLELSIKMQDKRLKNVMNLVFSRVNIDDSRLMKNMTEVSLKDSAAVKCTTTIIILSLKSIAFQMKQIAYLSMTFLPASFVATIFGMNIKELTPGDTIRGTLAHYVETAIPFTVATIWIIVAFESKYMFAEGTSFWKRLGWPILIASKLLRGLQQRRRGRGHDEFFDLRSPYGRNVDHSTTLYRR